MSHCDDNLKKIYDALKVYQEQHEGKNPSDLLKLENTEGLTAWDFVCPANGTGMGETPWVWRGGDLDANATGAFILAYDAKPVHKGRRNVLFADGVIKRPPEHFLKKALAKDNEIRQTYGLPEKPGP